MSCSPRLKSQRGACHRRRCRGSPRPERGAGWRTPSPTSALDFSLRTKTAAHSGWYGPCSGHSGEARDRLWRSGSRPSISVNSPSTPSSSTHRGERLRLTQTKTTREYGFITGMRLVANSLTWKKHQKLGDAPINPPDLRQKQGHFFFWKGRCEYSFLVGLHRRTMRQSTGGQPPSTSRTETWM